VSKLRNIFKSSQGLMDLQSVMVGVIVSAIITGVAIVSIVGMIRLTNVDTAKAQLRVLSTGMESFYTDNDRYPTNLQELANGDFIPKSYVSNATICMKSDTSTPYPQTYTAAVKVAQSGDIFFSNENTRVPTQGAAGSTYCFTN
jgi:Tfp pilus assembly protein PilE